MKKDNFYDIYFLKLAKSPIDKGFFEVSTKVAPYMKQIHKRIKEIAFFLSNHLQ